MSALSAEQIAQHAYNAGFRGKDLETAVAVALAESSGDPTKHNSTRPDDSYGLWQINMIDDLGPARRKQFGLDSDEELKDPATNAEAAYQVYKERGGTFEPWTTYTSEKYKEFLDEAEKAAKKVDRGSGGGPKQPNTPSGGSGGRRDGFSVSPERLIAYAKKTEQISETLQNTGKKTVHSVTGIAEDSFGKIGKETGFADALADFSRSLQKQVTAVGRNAGNLGAEAKRAAKEYQDSDALAAEELKKLLG